MSRIEEALRRAAQPPPLPDGFATADAGALDRFQAGVATVDPVAEPSAVRVTSNTDRSELTAADMNPALAEKVVVSDDVNVATVEQYRRLGATLHQAQSSQDVKVVMVASAVAAEGKTLTAVNLALTLSQSYGRRVLLIDADFRRPNLHDVFGVANVHGLNDSLKADSERKLTVFDISPRLALLPAGRPDPDPMRGLTSGRMRSIIDEASAKYDWVILDTPPLALITDAHLLAALVHIAVLVVQANRTPCALVQRAIEALGRDKIVGVVLNSVDERAASPGGKYGKYYTSSRYDQSSSDKTSGLVSTGAGA
jgi:capsular exopolysaccharide synthesis family protein